MSEGLFEWPSGGVDKGGGQTGGVDTHNNENLATQYISSEDPRIPNSGLTSLNKQTRGIRAGAGESSTTQSVHRGQNVHPPRPPLKPEHLDWLTGTGQNHPTPRRCKVCKQWTIAGFTLEPGAIPVTVTWDALTALGEHLARLHHLQTYTLRRGRHHATLETRTPRRILSLPPLADTPPWRTYDVIPAHICGANWAEPYTTTTRLTPPAAKETTDECPY